MARRLGPALAAAGLALAGFAALDAAFGALAAPPDRSFRAAHPYYHHGLRPLRSAETVWGGRRYELHTNSLGLRDGANTAVEQRPRDRRTVLIGDSMLEGLGVAYERTVAGILAARGRERGVEVLNAGVVSYSPKLYELRTRWLVEREGLELQRLVVFLDVSDVQDEVHYEAFVPRGEYGFGEAGLAWWRGHSLVAQLVRRFGAERAEIDNRFERDAEIDVWMRTVDAYRHATGNPDAGRWEWTYDDDAYRRFGERGLALAEAHMAALAAFTRERGIELALVVYPSPYQVLVNELESRHVSFWKRFCAREGVELLNLFPAFVDPLRAPLETYARYFIPDDVHWSEAGHAFVAELVADTVLGPARR